MCSSVCDSACLKQQFHLHFLLLISHMWSLHDQVFLLYFHGCISAWLNLSTLRLLSNLIPSTETVSNNNYHFCFIVLTWWVYCACADGEKKCPYLTVMSLLFMSCCRWRRWRSTIIAWPSARRDLRLRLTTSALTASRSTCAGTDMLPRYCVQHTRVRERKKKDIQ